MQPSSTLSSLEAFFGSLTAEITSKSAKLARSKSETDQDCSLTRETEEVSKTVEEAEDILEQMELEIRGMPEVDRQKCLNRWQSYKAELKRQVEQFNRSKVEVEMVRQRRALMGTEVSSDYDNASNLAAFHVDVKQRLLEDTETVERSGRKLNQGHQLLAETESIGAAVLQDLSQQRETIQRSRNRLRDTQDDLQSSSRVLSKMTNRIVQHKLILLSVGLVIIAVICYAFYTLFK